MSIAPRSRPARAPAMAWSFAALVLATAACGGRSGPPPLARSTDASTGTAAIPTAGARLVILLSADGLRGDAVTAEAMPFLHGRREIGASTLQARTDPTSTFTVPSHLCILTGRPTEGPQGHGFTANRWVDATVHEVRGFYVQSVFDVAHDHGVATAFVSGKTKLAVIPHAYDAQHGAPDTVGADDGRGKIDFVRAEDSEDDATLAAALAAIPDLRRPAFAFVHLAELDRVGHSDGFDPRPGTAYAAAARRIDERIARLAERLGDEATTVIVTADHGGDGQQHGDPTLLGEARVPFIAWGAGVDVGDLYERNPGRRRDPGERAQPSGEPPPIRSCEASNLALMLLGLPAVRGSVYDAAQDLRTGP